MSESSRLDSLHSRHGDREADKQQSPKAPHRLGRSQRCDARRENIGARLSLRILLEILDVILHLHLGVDIVLRQWCEHVCRWCVCESALLYQQTVKDF
jgi:hypothetical protein